MKYIVETQLPNSEIWHPVIDLDKSKVFPVIRKFDTEELAEVWAKKHSISSHKWRVVEDEDEDEVAY